MTDTRSMVTSRQRRNRVASELIPGMAQYNALADARSRSQAAARARQKDLVVGTKPRRQREAALLTQRRLAFQNRQ